MSTREHTARNTVLISVTALILIAAGIFSFLLFTMNTNREKQFAQLSTAANAIYLQINSQMNVSADNQNDCPLPAEGSYSVYGMATRRSLWFEDIGGSPAAMLRTDYAEDATFYMALKVEDGKLKGVWLCRKDLLHDAELRPYTADGDDFTGFFDIYGKKVIGSYP